MAAENVKELKDDNFDDMIKTGVAMVDFWAPWCRPCLMQEPIVAAVAEKVGDKATIGKMNVDETQATASRFGIRSIPTIILFKDGKPIQQFVGVQAEDVLVSAIESAL